jgi:GTP cyclohydrolase MptA (EC 3.5.4.-)
MIISIRLPDVQATSPDVMVNLNRVGVTDVKKLVEVARKDKRPIVLISKFDIFVDLPSNRKGANLSRNFEAMNEVLEEATASPVYMIEDLCGEITKKLLDRHEYAQRSEARMKSEYVVRRRTPATKQQCQEVIDIFAEASAERGKGIKKMIGAEVVGMTTCPCAQEMMTEQAIEELRKIGVDEAKIKEFISRFPMATHNQRGRGIISIETSEGYDVSLDDIIEVIEKSLSSPVFEFLKRSDEHVLVYNAHKNPKFVEDCVREMAKNVVENFSHLPDEAIVTIKQINEESIHRHNAFAERVAKMRELRDEINGGGNKRMILADCK